MGNLECSFAALFDKDLLQRYALENPYELVTSGKWTFDKMYEMCTAVMADLNGDGKYEGYDDQYGMTTFLQHGVFWAYLNSSGEYIIKKNSDDYPEFAMNMEIMQCIGRFREMQTNFGVIPFPKFDEAQKEYYTYSSNGVPLFCIPITSIWNAPG